MKKILYLLLVCFCVKTQAQKRKIPVDTIVVTNHTTLIKGKTVKYEAQTGMQPIWNEDGNPIATLFYTFYRRTDIKNVNKRPLIFSFNGGPGSGSVWMHIAYTGPKVLKIDEEGFPVPALELILAMPGSTIDDFYNEMEVIWNFQAWSSFRHDYMFLPDSRLNSESYKKLHNIQTVEVYTDIVDEDGSDNWHSLYRQKKTYFKTILSCNSFTRKEMMEMWFMNNAANCLLRNLYPIFIENISPSLFTKQCFCVIIKMDGWEEIYKEIKDIFDPSTPPKSIRQLGGKFRVETIEEFLKYNRTLIVSEVFKRLA